MKPENSDLAPKEVPNLVKPSNNLPTFTLVKRFLKELPNNLDNRLSSIAALIAGLIGLYPGIPDNIRPYMIALLVLIVLSGAWHKWNEQRKYIKTAIAIPFVINVANPADTLDALHKLFTIVEKNFQLKDHAQNLKEYLHIDEEDLYLKYGSGVPDELYDIDRFIRFLAVLQEKIDRLERLALNEMTICIAYIGPVSAAIAIGTILTHSRIVFYHLDRDADNKYVRVLESGRELKENLTSLQKFDIFASDTAGTTLDISLKNPLAIARNHKVTLALDISAHKISLNEPSIKNFGDIVHLTSKSNGTIQINENWGEYCQEIFNVLNSIQKQYGNQEIRLVYSMPAVLGMALGTVLQGYWNITLANYEKGTYRDFINLQDIPKSL